MLHNFKKMNVAGKGSKFEEMVLTWDYSETPVHTETETFPYMHSEGHAVAHLIGVLPIPGDFARPGSNPAQPCIEVSKL